MKNIKLPSVFFRIGKFLNNKVDNVIDYFGQSIEGMMFMLFAIILFIISLASAILGAMGSYVFGYEYTIFNSLLTLAVSASIFYGVAYLIEEYGYRSYRDEDC